MEILEKEVARVIEQSPELKQAMIGRGGNKAIQVNIQILGDAAINKTAAHQGDVEAALEYILEQLPPPKLRNLINLVKGITWRNQQSVRNAAQYLGICDRIFYRCGTKHYPLIEDIRKRGIDALTG